MKKNYISYFLLLFPFLDFFTSIATWEDFFSIGLLVKGGFLGYVSYELLKNARDKKIYVLFLVLFLYGVGDLGYWFIQDRGVLKAEVIHLIKIYYLPILILYFGTNKRKINPQIIIIWYFLFLLLYLLPYPFHLGHNISEIYHNKNLYLSYFYVGNELSNIFVLLLPTVLLYLMEKKDYTLTLITLILTLFMLVLLGTKTMYFSVLIIFVYFLFRYRKIVFVKLKQYYFFLLPLFLIGIGCLVLWIPNSALYKNINTSLEFYEVDSLTELFTFENIDHIIYSNRLGFLKNVHENYKKASVAEKVMGLGRARIMNLKDIEIDLFDIFYSVGIIGFIIYLLFFIQVLYLVKVKGVSFFTFILLCIISCFTGHVLISPMTTTYLAALFGVERMDYEKLDKKAIKKT